MLRVIRRNGALTISGTIAGTRVQRRAATNDPKRAEEEAVVIAYHLLQTKWEAEQRERNKAEAAAIARKVDALLAKEPRPKRPPRQSRSSGPGKPSRKPSRQPAAPDKVVPLFRLRPPGSYGRSR